MNFSKEITIIMSTYYNYDFTTASIFSIRLFYPNIRIILADGGSTDKTLLLCKEQNVDLISIPGASSEDCRNAAATLAETPFILFMDNDVKPLGSQAIPLLLEPMEDQRVAQTAAYCIKVIDRKNRKSFISTIFNGIMECDFAQGYFCLHRKKAWQQIGGFPKEWYFDGMSEFSDMTDAKYYNGGDLTISKHYCANGWKVVTPRERVPVLHWGKAAWWGPAGDQKVISWWDKNMHFKRIEPLNDWEKYKEDFLNE